jgi:hypothetical protein
MKLSPLTRKDNFTRPLFDAEAAFDEGAAERLEGFVGFGRGGKAGPTVERRSVDRGPRREGSRVVLDVRERFAQVGLDRGDRIGIEVGWTAIVRGPNDVERATEVALCRGVGIEHRPRSVDFESEAIKFDVDEFGGIVERVFDPFANPFVDRVAEARFGLGAPRRGDDGSGGAHLGDGSVHHAIGAQDFISTMYEFESPVVAAVIGVMLFRSLEVSRSNLGERRGRRNAEDLARFEFITVSHMLIKIE